MDRHRTDSELLTRFATERDEAAFARIVERHAGLVYAAALRQAGPSLAEDVSQAVFLILAQKAGQIDGRTLAGWLVNAARLAALASRRMELRRKVREQKAARMKHESGNDQDDDTPPWERLAPLLDEALSQLDEKDRSAVTLRYLQGRSVREVAEAMSVSESAAGKRATRAVQSLRDFFARRGVTLSTDSLGRLLSVHAVVAVPAGLSVKLAATATTAAATTITATASSVALSCTAGTLVKGTLPLMMTAKSHAVVAIAAAVFVVGGGVVAYQLVNAPRGAPVANLAPPADVRTIQAVAGVAPAALLPATTQPVVSSEILTRYPTPPGERATFSGRVEGLTGPRGEVGIVAMRGVQWTSFDNYQWQPVKADGTFTIVAEKFPEAERALAVRAPEQSVTFLRTQFRPDESARDVVVRMKPTRPITITANDSAGRPLLRFKAEVFDAGVAGPRLRDDEGRPLRSQRLDAPITGNGMIAIAVPLEPLSLLLSGDGIAPYFHIVDPRTSDHFDFTLLKATPLRGTLLDAGRPVAGERLMLNNDAVPLSYTARTTDAQGEFELPNGIPGTYNIAVRDRKIRVELVEGQPGNVTIDLAEPTTAPAEP